MKRLWKSKFNNLISPSLSYFFSNYRLKRAPYPVIIVVNKIDLLPEISLKLRRQPKQLKKLFSFNETLPKLIHPDIPLTRAKINETVTLDSVKEKWKALLPQAGKILPK